MTRQPTVTLVPATKLPRTIRLSQPFVGEAEIQAVADTLRSGQLAQGARVAELEARFAEYIGCEHAIATSSGSTALQLALLAHGVGNGDEVVTTPFSFFATASSVLHVGAWPVFADIDPGSLNLSPTSVLQHLTPRTRAILPVHLYGNPCDMPALHRIARQHGLLIIEDACQAHGAEFGDHRIGSSGTACFSFYPTKNMTSGEGGMICTSDTAVAERARLLRSHGQSQRYQHELLGFNFRMSDVHAAIGLAQLQRLQGANRARAENAAYYDGRLLECMERPIAHVDARPAWHQYTLVLDPTRRNAVANYLSARGVETGIYYPLPLHRQPAIQGLGIQASCPIADAAALGVLSIPVHAGLSTAERAFVATEVLDALARA